MAVEDRAAARLSEIAALLGCPVEAFFAPSGVVPDIRMTHELLALWVTIRQPQTRQRILDFVRSETEDRLSANAAE